MRLTHSRATSHRGGALVSAIVFVLIISLGLAAMGKLAVSQYENTLLDNNYASALSMAEAGVNFEYRSISTNTSSADQISLQNPQGVTYSLGPGTFTVYCENKDGSTPWSPPNNLYVVSTGTVNGVSRTVKVSTKGYNQTGPYAVFALKNGTLNGVPKINGSVETDGQLLFNGGPTVTGPVVFNGAGSGWSGSNDDSKYQTVYNSNPVPWPTVDQIANKDFPQGGLTWLATHNDDSLVSAISGTTLTINGNKTVTLVGKAGGANYYLTSLVCNGNGGIQFDNTLGTVTIWMGPNNGTGSCTLNGGVAAVSMSQDPTKACRIYSALASTVTLNGNCNLDGGVYAYDVNKNGQTIGAITNNGTPTVNGSILAPNITLNGTPTINYTSGYFQSSGVGYYGFDNSWDELNGVQ